MRVVERRALDGVHRLLGVVEWDSPGFPVDDPLVAGADAERVAPGGVARGVGQAGTAGNPPA